MKKLMIGAVVALAACAVNASTAAWNASNIYQYGLSTDDSNNKAAIGQYYVMTFIETETLAKGSGATEYKTLSSAEAKTLAGKASTLATLNSSAMANSGTLTAKGTFVSTALDGNWGSGDYLKVYAIIFDNADYTKANHFIITDTKDYTFGDSGDNKTFVLGSQKAATWNNIESVPEPTSAMLLLLGVAGLALRRRRA